MHSSQLLAPWNLDSVGSSTTSRIGILELGHSRQFQLLRAKLDSLWLQAFTKPEGISTSSGG